MKSIILKITIIISMMILLIPFSANAESGTCGDNLTWQLTDDGTIIIGTDDITLYAVWKKIICTETQILNGTFVVTPTGVENGDKIVFACYNGDKLVYINPYVYAGETTIPFTTTETYDKVKAMVWDGSMPLSPLCTAEDVSLN